MLQIHQTRRVQTKKSWVTQKINRAIKTKSMSWFFSRINKRGASAANENQIRDVQKIRFQNLRVLSNKYSYKNEMYQVGTFQMNNSSYARLIRVVLKTIKKKKVKSRMVEFCKILTAYLHYFVENSVIFHGRT